MADLSSKLDLASALFGKRQKIGTNTVKGTVQADSSSGSVSVKIGEVEYDEDGNIITPEADLIATIPIIGSASTGDEVTIITQDGTPTAIAAPGWGDSIEEKTQYITFVDTGADAGLHIHEDESSYNTDGDLHLTSGGLEIRDSGTVVADFDATTIHLGKNSVTSTIDLLNGSTQLIAGKYSSTDRIFQIVSSLGVFISRSAINSSYLPTSGFIRLGYNAGNGVEIVGLDANDNTWLTVNPSNIQITGAASGLTINGDPGTSGYVLTSQGAGSPPIWAAVPGASLPFCHAVNTSATTSIGSTVKNVTLHSIDIQSADGSDYFEISGGGVKCKQAGKIEVNGSCYFSTATASWSRGVYLLNGSTEIGTSGYGSGYSSSVMACQAVTTVAAGDIIHLAARSSSSNSAAVNYATHLSIKYLEI